MPQKQPIKHCHECRHFIPPDPPSEDARCQLAVDSKALTGYTILQSVKFQRSSGFITDCGPGGNYWEAATSIIEEPKAA